MKFKTNYFILAIFLLILLVLSMMVSCRYYRTHSSKMNEYFTSFEKSDDSKYGVYGSEKQIDMFSKVEGSLDCEGSNAFNLSNSMGPLCVKDKKINSLMRSRGGNAASGESQIGY